MENQQLIDFIKQSRQAGKPDPQIRQELLGAGWEANEINIALNLPNLSPKNRKKKIIILFFIIIILLPLVNSKSYALHFLSVFLLMVGIGVLMYYELSNAGVPVIVRILILFIAMFPLFFISMLIMGAVGFGFSP